MQRKAFSFLRSFYDAAKLLNTKEEQADFLMAVCNYGLNGEEPEETTGTAAAMFKLVKPNLDVAFAKAEAGAKGGKANRKQIESKQEADGSNPEAIKDKGLRIKDKDIHNNNYSESTSSKPVDNVDNSHKSVDNSDNVGNAEPDPDNDRPASLDGMDLYKLSSRDAFEMFRQKYPRRQGALRDVQTAWVTATVGSHILPGDLVRAAERYAEECRENGTEARFIKMPQNFISSGTWKQYAPKYLPSCPRCHGQGTYEQDGGMVMCDCDRRYG